MSSLEEDIVEKIKKKIFGSKKDNQKMKIKNLLFAADYTQEIKKKILKNYLKKKMLMKKNKNPRDY